MDIEKKIKQIEDEILELKDATRKMNRSLLIGGVSLAIALIGIPLMVSLSIRSEVFSAVAKVDEAFSGKYRISELETKKIRIVDDGGNTVVFIAGESDGGKIKIRDDNGINRITLHVDEKNKPNFYLNDENGLKRLYLNLALESNDPVLTFWAKGGENNKLDTVLKLSAYTNGKGFIKVNKKEVVVNK